MPNSPRHLHHTKAFRTTTGVGKPRPNEGSNGDMTIRALESGLYFFIKYGNLWYKGGKLEVYNPKDSSGGRLGGLADSSGGLLGAGSKRFGKSNDMVINSGSKLLFGAKKNVKKSLLDTRNYIQSGNANTSGSLGNKFSRDFLKMVIGGRVMIQLDENSANSRIIAGNSSNKAAFQSNQFYVSHAYNVTLADVYTKIHTDNETSIILTCGDSDNQTNLLYLKENGGGANDYIAMPATAKFYLDGGNNTYIQEASADHIAGVAGGVQTFELDNTSLKIGANLNITITDAKIASSADLSIDSGGDLYLDTHDEEIYFQHRSATFGYLSAASSKTHFRLYEQSGSPADYFNITVGGSASSAITTVNAGGAAANLSLDIDGSITLNSATGVFISEMDGTEFSASNSAYAGMILGYTRLEGDLTNQSSFEIQDSLTVEDDTHKITFKTPPSEYVEIEAQMFINVQSTDTNLDVGLSSANATDGYTTVSQELEYDYGCYFSDDELDDDVLVLKWVLGPSHLASIGGDNTFWIGFGTSGVSKSCYLQYGLRSANNIAYPPFIIKATALPATIYDGQ